MNYPQIKQFLFNNMLYGEQENNSALLNQHITIPLLVMPNSSKIWGIDISHWNIPPVDLQRMKNLYGLSFVIIKGCDGTIKSRYFDEHLATARAIGLPVGIYNWLYPSSRVSIDAQTSAWSIQAKAVNPELGIFVDAEWTYYAGSPANPNAADLRTAHDLLRNKYGKPATTYTAKGYADEFLIGFDWSREELWVANYGVSSPNLPRGATNYKFWQFTSTLDGAVLDPNGSNKELDGNYFNGTMAEFLARYGKYEQTNPFPGVVTIKGNAVWDFTIDIIDPKISGVGFKVVHGNKLKRPSDFTLEFGAELSYNAGEWEKHITSPNYQMPQDLSITDGVVYVPGTYERPSLLILENGTAVIDTAKHINVKQALTGNWYIVQNGKPVYVTGTDPRYTEGHARTIFGLDSAGRVMVMVADGTYTDAPDGLTLKECAEIMIQVGAVIAFDGGSGGDSVRVESGKVTNNPQDGYVRAVPETFMVFSKEINMTQYTATTIYSTRIRVDHNTNNTSDISVPGGTQLNGNILFTAPTNLYTATGSQYQMIGDVWLQISEGVHTGKWVAIKHMGGIICKLDTNTTPPPPTVKSTLIELTYDDADNITGIKVDGKTWVKSLP